MATQELESVSHMHSNRCLTAESFIAYFIGEEFSLCTISKFSLHLWFKDAQKLSLQLLFNVCNASAFCAGEMLSADQH